MAHHRGMRLGLVPGMYEHKSGRRCIKTKDGESVRLKKSAGRPRSERDAHPARNNQVGKNYSTPYSRVISHRSTDDAATSLTSEIGRDPVLSGAYGRS